jgi:hypothetical protein
MPHARVALVLLLGTVIGAVSGPGAQAQSAQPGVDMSLPRMTEANLTRAEVAALLDAAKPGAPADLSGAWLNGLDL